MKRVGAQNKTRFTFLLRLTKQEFQLANHIIPRINQSYGTLELLRNLPKF